MRKLPYAVALLGVVVLIIGLGLAGTASSQARTQRAELSHDAKALATSLGTELERARSLDLLLAQSPAFTTDLRTTRQLGQAALSLGYLNVLYSFQVEAASVVDSTGRELVRVSHGASLPAEELRDDAGNRPWFAPTMALLSGDVYQGAPYRSAATGAWVVSTSTWIPHSDHGGRLIVQFEVTLESFRQHVDSAGGPLGRHQAFVEGDRGRVALQNGVYPTSSDPLPTTDWSTSLIHRTDAAGDLKQGALRLAYHRVEVSRSGDDEPVDPDTDGVWWAVLWSDQGSGVWAAWGGLGVAVVGFLLVLGALLSFWRQHSTMRHAARVDHLTGLANRKAFEEGLEAALAPNPLGLREPRGWVGVLLIDLDGFKQINDRLGHDRGDMVLHEVGRRLRDSVWERDVPARLGGDEFAVVLTHLRGPEEISAVAGRIRDALIRPIEIDGVARFVGASVGVSIYPNHSTSASELLRQADAAMYQAKRGREGVRVYDPGTEAGIEALGMAADLLAVIEGNQITMQFQPQFDPEGQRVLAVEALARWTTGEGEVIPPGSFIPMAEETGLIRSLTTVTLRQALDAAAAWRASGSRVPVSVNLSAVVLGDISLPDQVAALLAERGLPGETLVLEVTDRAAANENTAVPMVIDRLRHLGIRIWLDDFGSGRTSLAAVRELPLDAIKVDLAHLVEQSPGEVRVLSAVIDLVHGLGLPVYIEGVEDDETWAKARTLGCDGIQGFHLVPPLDATEVAKLFRAQPELVRQSVSAG